MAGPQNIRPKPPRIVQSLLAEMKDGDEYGSIAGLVCAQPDLIPELRKGLSDVEKVRGRPCVCYVANVIKDVPDTAIVASDHLPFAEMIGKIPAAEKSLDVFLATPGGSGEQVNRIVSELRSRFDNIEFIIPDRSMSAGTLWALSGDRIWMDSRASLGPIDPQTPTRDGRLLPAQSLLLLLAKIQKEGEEALQKGRNPDWSHLQLLKEMPKEIGHALSSSAYVTTMAAEFLEKYKFKTWTAHTSTGAPVTPDERKRRALEVAGELCSHERWKAHGHAITRDVMSNEVRILIDHPEAVPGLERSIRRLWALLYYVFERAPVSKLLFSNDYKLVRTHTT